jgi:hypothetical protein
MHQPWDAIFLNVAVGLLLSDPAADIVAFMHGNHGSDHHLLAFVKSNAPGVNAGEIMHRLAGEMMHQ